MKPKTDTELLVNTPEAGRANARVRSDVLFGLLRKMLNKHFTMAADEHKENASHSSLMRHAAEFDAAEAEFMAALKNTVAALEEIDRECSGALNNAFPEDAPDILAHVQGIAARALRGPNAELTDANRTEK